MNLEKIKHEMSPVITVKGRSELLELAVTTAARGVRERVVVDSFADWLDDEVPTAWIACLLESVWRRPQLDFHFPTKHPENWRVRVQAVHDMICTQNPDFGAWLSEWLDGEPPSNVHFLGAN